MTTTLLTTLEPITPSESESRLAREASRRLAAYLGKRRKLRLQLIEDGQPGEVLTIPASALRLLVYLLNEMAEGNTMALIPINAELTTQQAADILNVSRPFLVRLLDDGGIPCRTVGTHRRVLLKDVMAYKNGIDRDRLAALDELAAQAQELRMGY